MRAFAFLGLSLVLTVASAEPARAALIAYESFDYAPAGADLVGANGGIGFSSGWRAGGFNASISNNFDRSVDSIDFPPLLSTEGSVRALTATAISGVTRDLATPLGQAGSTVYLSFLIQPQGPLDVGAFSGFLGLTLESPGEPELYIGKPGGGAIRSWVLEERGGARQHSSGVATIADETALLVVKAQFNVVGNDIFTLYVNPTPGAPEPALGTVMADTNLGTVQGLTIYSTGAMLMDEIRVGETFADVTPVPEPGSLFLLLGGGAAFIMARGRFAVGR